ncbi:MAG: hypothetical protein ITG02_08655 [Patulibacter sp.]|nr:hypothetical protein [Patulibacter sp.]
MRSLINRRPTASTVISCTALFVALGGTSYAAVTIDGKDLKNRSVTAKKVKTRTLTGTQIKNNTLTGKQIKESTLATVPRAGSAQTAQSATNAHRAVTAGTADNAAHAENAKNATNATNAENATNAQNAQSAATAANADQLAGKPAAAFAASATRVVIESATAVVGSVGGTNSSATASCDAGERAISGGGSWMTTGFPVQIATANVTVPTSRPVTTGGELTGWQVAGRNEVDGVSRQLRAYVVCSPKS